MPPSLSAVPLNSSVVPPSSSAVPLNSSVVPPNLSAAPPILSTPSCTGSLASVNPFQVQQSQSAANVTWTSSAQTPLTAPRVSTIRTGAPPIPPRRSTFPNSSSLRASALPFDPNIISGSAGGTANNLGQNLQGLPLSLQGGTGPVQPGQGGPSNQNNFVVPQGGQPGPQYQNNGFPQVPIAQMWDMFTQFMAFYQFQQSFSSQSSADLPPFAMSGSGLFGLQPDTVVGYWSPATSGNAARILTAEFELWSPPSVRLVIPNFGSHVSSRGHEKIIFYYGRSGKAKNFFFGC